MIGLLLGVKAEVEIGFEDDVGNYLKVLRMTWVTTSRFRINL